jgi:molybdopterin synthase sulfur carrier subunit
MKTIPIQVFGMLTDLTGQPIVDVEYAGDTVSLMQNILTQYPVLGQHQFIMAVNQTIVTDNQQLDEKADIVLMPPFSGG